MTKANKAGALVKFLDSKSLEVQTVMPEKESVERALKMAIVAATDNPKILECTHISIYRALLQTCHLGISLSPILNEAHFIPYGGKCTLQLGYRGWIKLVTESDKIQDIYADTVCENDIFKVVKGSRPDLVHEYAPVRGVPTHVYAMAFFRDGHFKFEVVPWSDIEKAKQLSKKGGKVNPAWAMWQEEMSKKVAIKRLCKVLIPMLGHKGEKLAHAAAIENNAGDDGFLDPEIDDLEDFIEATTVVDGEIGEVPEIPKSLKERLAHDQDG